MNELFGIPTGTLARRPGRRCSAVSLVAIAALAIRNRILFKLGVRNVARRRGRTALIVVGLMLGTTIIAAAMTTGDTMSHTIRSSAVTSARPDRRARQHARGRGRARSAASSAAAARPAPSATSRETPAVRRSTRPRAARASSTASRPRSSSRSPSWPRARGQTEPRVTLFASDPGRLDGFGDITLTDGRPIALAELKQGAVFLNEDAADELDARAGDIVRVLAGGRTRSVRVRAIVDYDGTGTDGPGGAHAARTRRRGCSTRRA